MFIYVRELFVTEVTSPLSFNAASPSSLAPSNGSIFRSVSATGAQMWNKIHPIFYLRLASSPF